MARSGKGFAGRIFDEGFKLASKAAEKVMSDPRGQDAVARAVGLAQRGVRRIEGLQERVMKAAGIPGRQDYQELAKQLARIKRKARELSARLEAEREGQGEPGPEGGEPRGNRPVHH